MSISMICVICIATWSLTTHQISSHLAEPFPSSSFTTHFDTLHVACSTCQTDLKNESSPVKSFFIELIYPTLKTAWIHHLEGINFPKASPSRPARRPLIIGVCPMSKNFAPHFALRPKQTHFLKIIISTWCSAKARSSHLLPFATLHRNHLLAYFALVNRLACDKYLLTTIAPYLLMYVQGMNERSHPGSIWWISP